MLRMMVQQILRSARLTLDSSIAVLAGGIREPMALEDARARLGVALWNETDEPDLLSSAVEAVQVELERLKMQPAQEA